MLLIQFKSPLHVELPGHEEFGRRGVRHNMGVNGSVRVQAPLVGQLHKLLHRLWCRQQKVGQLKSPSKNVALVGLERGYLVVFWGIPLCLLLHGCDGRL